MVTNQLIIDEDEAQQQRQQLEVRLKSVASLLTTLSGPHYETLKVFSGLLHEYVRVVLFFAFSHIHFQNC